MVAAASVFTEPSNSELAENILIYSPLRIDPQREYIIIEKGIVVLPVTVLRAHGKVKSVINNSKSCSNSSSGNRIRNCDSSPNWITVPLIGSF